MKETITMRWIRDGKHGEKEIDRQEFLSKFKELVAGYPDNNEISKKMCLLIPDLEQIRIDYDINQTQDTPCITYKIHNGVFGFFKILRHHKIVWNTLHEYCKE